MKKIKDISELVFVGDEDLRHFLTLKYEAMLEEYQCSMSEIGEIVILESTDELAEIFSDKKFSDFEFIKIEHHGNSDYIHMVYIVSDYFACDIFCKGEQEYEKNF